MLSMLDIKLGEYVHIFKEVTIVLVGMQRSILFWFLKNKRASKWVNYDHIIIKDYDWALNSNPTQNTSN
jgi:hypothetical protein